MVLQNSGGILQPAWPTTAVSNIASPVLATFIDLTQLVSIVICDMIEGNESDVLNT